MAVRLVCVRPKKDSQSDFGYTICEQQSPVPGGCRIRYGSRLEISEGVCDSLLPCSGEVQVRQLRRHSRLAVSFQFHQRSLAIQQYLPDTCQCRPSRKQASRSVGGLGKDLLGGLWGEFVILVFCPVWQMSLICALQVQTRSPRCR
jgi:hypothetical protein